MGKKKAKEHLPGKKKTVLVIGCKPDSLGEAIVMAARDSGYNVVTAGINCENYFLDLVAAGSYVIDNAIDQIKPNHIVCTVGVNYTQPIERDATSRYYSDHFAANVIGPMRLLDLFGDWVLDNRGEGLRHFVAISSNSAGIPRTSSAAYCASKAALSQALRVKAREARGGDYGYIVYGYEPGWLVGTPMSAGIASQFPDGQLHRMRGQNLEAGVDTHSLAWQIVAGLIVPGAALNGATIRYDGGEL